MNNLNKDISENFSDKDIEDMVSELETNYVLKLKCDKNIILDVISILDKLKWYRYKDQNYFDKPTLTNNKLSFDCIYIKRKHIVDDTYKNNEGVKFITNNENILKIVNKYLQKDCYLKANSIIHCENDGKLETINKFKWHLDDFEFKPTFKFIKLFIPLCKINKDNGVTHVIKNSRTKLPSNDLKKLQNRFEDSEINERYNKNDIITLNGDIGDIFIVRTDGLHKGGFVKKGYRTLIIIEYRTI